MWNQAERGQFRAVCLCAAAIILITLITNFVRDGVAKHHAARPRSDAAAAARIHTRHNYTQTGDSLHAATTACLPIRTADSASGAEGCIIGDAARVHSGQPNAASGDDGGTGESDGEF